MVYRRFSINIIIRVCILALIAFGMVYGLTETEWLITNVVMGFVLLGLIVELIYYVERTNRDLKNFLLAIKYRDFANTFTLTNLSPSHNELKEAFNIITNEFQNLRAEKESNHQYLQNVVEHVGVALICFDEDGKIQLMNQAAQKMLHKPYLQSIQALKYVDADLLYSLQKLKSGERELSKLVIQDEILNLAVEATEFKLQDKYYKLISLQNIRSELDEKELEAWQKLIRVTTHEIMNSVTPIISLTELINTLIEDEEGNQKPLDEIHPEDIEDIRQGLHTIENRSKGLLRFVNAYRSIYKQPKPNFQKVVVQDLLQRLAVLFKSEWQQRNIRFEMNLPPYELMMTADPELLEQVLINLLKNAMQAVEKKPDAHIKLNVFRTVENRTIIQVEDNGGGISEELKEQVFIPFFTTKEKGSGVGLSLSRQIMRLHKGRIWFNELEEGVVFNIEV
ncbi:MAG: PAS domain-containing sensor histidine kinase [Chitinophagales bacterium]